MACVFCTSEVIVKINTLSAGENCKLETTDNNPCETCIKLFEFAGVSIHNNDGHILLQMKEGQMFTLGEIRNLVALLTYQNKDV